jgi:hypothetical protein
MSEENAQQAAPEAQQPDPVEQATNALVERYNKFKERQNELARRGLNPCPGGVVHFNRRGLLADTIGLASLALAGELHVHPKMVRASVEPDPYSPAPVLSVDFPPGHEAAANNISGGQEEIRRMLQITGRAAISRTLEMWAKDYFFRLAACDIAEGKSNVAV